MQARRLRSAILLATCLVSAIMLIACGRQDVSRTEFTEAVMNHTQDEVTATMGRPDEVDESVPGMPCFIYLRRTVNPQDRKQVDQKTYVRFTRQGDGKFRVAKVDSQ